MTQKKAGQNKKQRHKERMAAKKKKQQIRMMMIGSFVVIILAFGAAALYYANSGADSDSDKLSEQSDGQAQPKKFDFPYNKQPVFGDKDASVKIVEFGDYKCPACQAFNQQVFPLIRNDFIDSGKAAFYFMNYSTIPGSLDAALAAEAIFHQGNDMYWKYHEAIYDNQGDESEDWATPEFLAKFVKENVPKVDIEQLKKNIEEQTYLEQIKSDKQKGVEAGVQGTPTIFVNGEKVARADYASIKEAIQKVTKKNES